MYTKGKERKKLICLLVLLIDLPCSLFYSICKLNNDTNYEYIYIYKCVVPLLPFTVVEKNSQNFTFLESCSAGLE